MLVQNGDAHPIVPIESVFKQTDPGWLLWAIWTLQTPSLKQFEFFKLLGSTTNCHPPKRLTKKYITFLFFRIGFTHHWLQQQTLGNNLLLGMGWWPLLGFFPVEKQLRVFSMRIFFSRKCLERDKTSTRNCSELLTVELPMEKTHTHIGWLSQGMDTSSQKRKFL